MGRAHGPGPMGMGIRLQFWDPTFRVNVAEPPRLRTKYNLSELIPGFPGFPGNGPNPAVPALGSTRAGGKGGNLPKNNKYASAILGALGGCHGASHPAASYGRYRVTRGLSKHSIKVACGFPFSPPSPSNSANSTSATE